jgi:hypothetical protein
MMLGWRDAAWPKTSRFLNVAVRIFDTFIRETTIDAQVDIWLQNVG